MSQHAELTLERWARFDTGRQILQIGVEMHRAAASLRPDRIESLHRAYERVLRLVDLTVEANPRRAFRRELLRWRDVVAGLYLRREPDEECHRRATRALLYMHPDAAPQVALLGL